MAINRSWCNSNDANHQYGAHLCCCAEIFCSIRSMGSFTQVLHRYPNALEDKWFRFGHNCKSSTKYTAYVSLNGCYTPRYRSSRSMQKLFPKQNSSQRVMQRMELCKHANIPWFHHYEIDIRGVVMRRNSARRIYNHSECYKRRQSRSA